MNQKKKSYNNPLGLILAAPDDEEERQQPTRT